MKIVVLYLNLRYLVLYITKLIAVIGIYEIVFDYGNNEIMTFINNTIETLKYDI